MAKKKSVFFQRLILVAVCVVVGFIGVIIKLFILQTVQAEKHQQMALKQWTTDTSITAARGRILDTNGDVLAQSGTVYKVLAWPQEINDSDRERIAAELAKVLDMSVERVSSRLAKERVLEDGGTMAIKETVIARQIDRETVDKIEALKLGGGIVTAIDTKRYYPRGSLLSQVLGFTNIDSDGQEGIELTYNKYLAGENGRMITETDRAGQKLAYGVQEYVEATDGADLVLTVDSTVEAILEKKLEEALTINKGKTAQGIVMNCKTGEILAISTKPDYDPNNPPRDDLELLASLMRNRVIADAYEPGSTFKIVTLSAAIDSATVSPDSFSATCGGARVVDGQTIKCWKKGGHGTQNLTESTENSCNCAFMDMALALGTEELYEYIYKFGFGSTTDCGLAGESAGIVINKKYIRTMNLARIGFGQSIAVTPIQLATAVSAAVNGGILYQPYIIKQIVGSDGTVILENTPTEVRRVISEESSATVRGILESVVENGSGRNAKIEGYRVGGKTGTAQKYDETGVAAGKLIASFIGFAPADDPEYVVLVLVDEPQVGQIFGSTVAAPFVKDILEETLRHYGHLPIGSEQTVQVPYLIGMTTAEAEKALAELGLTAVFQTESIVTAQVPTAGEYAIVGTDVLIYTDDIGIVPEEDETVPATVKVPRLVGKTRLEAYDALKALGLYMQISGEYDGGKVLTQSLEPGTEVTIGTTVTVTFET